jgi:hypothetical protein
VRYVPGEVLLRFAPGVTVARRNLMLGNRAATRLRRFATLDIDHVRLPPGVPVEAAVAAFRAMPGVLHAQPNYRRRAIPGAPPNDPFWLNGSLWGLSKIKAPSVWANFTAGDGSVVVADIDTGVDYTHPDLAANMWRNPGEVPGNSVDDDGNGYIDDVFGIDTVNHDSDPMDDEGHGTHTSGTIAAAGNNGAGVVGVLWRAQILSCKFLSAAGVGTDAGAIECFDYLVASRCAASTSACPATAGARRGWGRRRRRSRRRLTRRATSASSTCSAPATTDRTMTPRPSIRRATRRRASSRWPRRDRPTGGPSSATSA